MGNLFTQFGEFSSFEEINELAENLFNEGDTDSMKAMAKENGIQEDFVEMYLQGSIPVLCDALTAALGKIDMEAADRRLREVAGKYPNIRQCYRKLRAKYFYEDESYIIRPAKSAEEIVIEGRVLHHCVGGDGYLSKHNRGETYILMLRFKENPQIPYITVEISGKYPNIRQWYGEKDRKPDAENIQKWLDSYLMKLKSGTMTGITETAIA